MDLAKQEEINEADYDPDLLKMKRRCEEAGLTIRIPRRGAKWREFKPLPIDADELSAMVVRLRHEDGL